MEELEWMEEALCKGKHNDLWFPPFSDERDAPEKQYFDIAKMVCEHCPVQVACRYQGAAEEFGVWGGTDPYDRRKGGKPVLPPMVLMPRYVHKVPDHTPGLRLDIKAVSLDLRRFSDPR